MGHAGIKGYIWKVGRRLGDAQQKRNLEKKGILSPRGQAVRATRWHLLSHLSTVTFRRAKGKQETGTPACHQYHIWHSLPPSLPLSGRHVIPSVCVAEPNCVTEAPAPFLTLVKVLSVNDSTFKLLFYSWCYYSCFFYIFLIPPALSPVQVPKGSAGSEHQAEKKLLQILSKILASVQSFLSFPWPNVWYFSPFFLLFKRQSKIHFCLSRMRISVYWFLKRGKNCWLHIAKVIWNNNLLWEVNIYSLAKCRKLTNTCQRVMRGFPPPICFQTHPHTFTF